jgi:hypothetical protein
MLAKLKNRLREKLLGGRYSQAVRDGRLALGNLGNRAYLQHYPHLARPGYQPPLQAFEFSYFSQNGEDGLILHLLSRAGVYNHYVVEIGIEDGRQCNSANLLLNFGWHGCLIEASADWAAKARQYFTGCGAMERLALLNAAAAPGNIRDLFDRGHVPDQIDVLSIDIDSFDYWLWQAVDWISPRLVVIEYNASFGPGRAVSVPYRPDGLPPARYYHGASIGALHKLGRRKGYVLAGCDSKGVNAFFVRADLAAAAGIADTAPAQAWRPHFRRSRKMTTEQQFECIAHMPLQQID